VEVVRLVGALRPPSVLLFDVYLMQRDGQTDGQTDGRSITKLMTVTNYDDDDDENNNINVHCVQIKSGPLEHRQ